MRARVVVADDLPVMLSAVSVLLSDAFDVVATVTDGQAALSATLSLEPDLLVLDVSMPGMNGIELARELKKRASKSRIVYLTGHEDGAILEACLEAGRQGYVLKESMESDLVTAMNDALGDRIFVSQFPNKQKAF